MASDANATLIGRSAVVRGEISGDGDVQIEGSLEGSVQVTGARITVGPEAKVRALLSAQDIVVHGRVEGELRATGRAELRASATVVGDIFAARLSVEQDATVRGHVDSIQAAEKSAAAGAEVEGGRGPQAWRSTTSSAHIPSGLAAAAATVATSQRGGTGAAGDAGEGHAAKTTEPKSS